jgi:GTPase Era involved in 16S rRNA processing
MSQTSNRWMLEDDDAEWLKTRRLNIMKGIQEAYADPNCVPQKARYIDIRNIVLIGRTKTGKSTLFEMIANPTKIPVDQTLFSITESTVLHSLVIDDARDTSDNTSTDERNVKKLALTIVDTPGLFEHKKDGTLSRDNTAILEMISTCINKEITKFHVICFCISCVAGINDRDVDAINLLIEHIGPAISDNSCLIITRSESMRQVDRNRRLDEFQTGSKLKDIIPFFKKGIFFTGALNADDWHSANDDNLKRQFKTICNYRQTLLNLFRSSNDPFDVSHLKFSEIQKSIEKRAALQAEMNGLKVNEQQNAQQIAELQKKIDDAWCSIM